MIPSWGSLAGNRSWTEEEEVDHIPIDQSCSPFDRAGLRSVRVRLVQPRPDLGGSSDDQLRL